MIHRDMGIWEVRLWKILWFVPAGVLVGFACWFIVQLDERVNESLEHVRAARKQGDTLVDMAQDYGRPIADDIRELTASVSEAAPKIVENTQVVTDAAAVAAKDVHQFRELIGAVSEGESGKMSYASDVLKLVERSGGKIGTRSVIGKGLRSLEDAAHWVGSVRTEAGVLVMSAATKHDVLVGLSRSVLRSDFYITFDEGKTSQKLVDWLALQHPETAQVLKSVSD